MEKELTDYQYCIIQKIKRIRQENEITQVQLSGILGISNGQLGNIESPNFQHKYTLRQIYKFCEYVDYPIEKIFLSDEDMSKSIDNIIKKLMHNIIEYEK